MRNPPFPAAGLLTRSGREQKELLSRQMLVQVVIPAIKLNESHPVYRTRGVTELIDEVFGKSVDHFAFFKRKGLVVFLRPVTYWLDDVCV